MSDQILTQRPPLGVVPRRLHNEIRFGDLLQALHRRVSSGAGMDRITDEWMQELNEIYAHELKRTV